MGKSSTIVKEIKANYIYIITIVLLLGLTIGFLIGFVKERSKDKGKCFVNFFFLDSISLEQYE
jgi:hypothetical protein